MSFENSKVKEKEESKEIKYKDGIYSGVADGFRPNNELEVVIEEGEIVDIKVLASNDTPSFLTTVFNRLVPQIIESQSLDVDVVSGATLSSKGIINAIKDALSKAEKN
ncbi:MAG: FMN-binding protein [Sarcina sp.]